jgi:predicted DNA-binding transcriptional regulator AlpA
MTKYFDMTNAMQEGRWPRCLPRALAAAYLGMSTDTFDANVDRGALPQPFKMPTGMWLWDRADLDTAIDILKTGRSPNEEVRNVREGVSATAKRRS